MKELLQDKKIKSSELKKLLLNIREKSYIELKKANELPNAFWETYSSFSNTSGGWIILGVAEGNPYNEIIGVGNVEKTLTSLWDQLSNENKVSYRNINNEDVNTYTIDGKPIIIIYVKEAPESKKPVHLGRNIYNSWIRTGDGDRKMNDEELASFIRNANPGQDNLPIDNFTINDLDLESVISYKERVNKRFPKKKYIEMSNEEFLIEIGACVKDRITEEIKIKKGTLLFLGKINSIKEIFPHYHVDYFNKKGNNPRWSDRVADDEPSDYEMNIFNFFNIVYGKLKNILSESFELDENQRRKPVSDFDETLRECLVNCLAHADYVQSFPSIKIEVYDGWFSFLNPGKMLVSTEQFLLGGDSRPRNETIMKLFRLFGVSERQGFGGPLIYKTAVENDYKSPEIITDIEKTEIKVWNIDIADSYAYLSYDEKNVLRYIAKSDEAQSISSIRSALKITDYKARNIVHMLEDSKLIIKIGSGPSTKYGISITSAEYLAKLQIKMHNLKNTLV